MDKIANMDFITNGEGEWLFLCTPRGFWRGMLRLTSLGVGKDSLASDVMLDVEHKFFLS